MFYAHYLCDVNLKENEMPKIQKFQLRMNFMDIPSELIKN